MSRFNRYNYTGVEQLAQKTNVGNDRVNVLNDASATNGGGEFANFAGQTLGASAPIGFIEHHYTDGIVHQIDNVGAANTILLLKNANNPVRRPDQPSSFVGSGKFLSLNEHSVALGYAKESFFISKDAEFIWTGAKGSAYISQNKTDDGTFAFVFKCYNVHTPVARFLNVSSPVLEIYNDVTNTRANISAPSNQTSGLYLESKAGNIRLNPNGTWTELIGKARIGDGSNWATVQTITRGTTAQRPTTNLEAGQYYFDTDLGRPIWRNAANNDWIYGITSGTTAQRPTAGIAPGYNYFDTTLNKPIWRNSANGGWVDSTGASV